MTIPQKTDLAAPRRPGDLAILIGLAAATVLVHVLTGHQYGFQRDELATLEDARHLAFGFVAYPPITPLFGRLSLILFGTSLAGFRFFAAVAQGVALVFVGLMARELGGRRGAQLVAAGAGVAFALGGGALMQYVSFDYLCWVLVSYFVIRLLRSDDPRWWMAIGTAIGLGMESKYTMGFFVLAIVAGVVLTPERKYLASKWLWAGVGHFDSGVSAEFGLASAASFYFAGFSEAYSHAGCRRGAGGRFSTGAASADFAGHAAGAGRALVLSGRCHGKALSHARLDVCGDAGSVCGGEGTMVLPGGRVSDAVCRGRGLGRAVAGGAGRAHCAGACAAWLGSLLAVRCDFDFCALPCRPRR